MATESAMQSSCALKSQPTILRSRSARRPAPSCPLPLPSITLLPLSLLQRAENVILRLWVSVKRGDDHGAEFDPLRIQVYVELLRAAVDPSLGLHEQLDILPRLIHRRQRCAQVSGLLRRVEH